MSADLTGPDDPRRPNEPESPTTEASSDPDVAGTEAPADLEPAAADQPAEVETSEPEPAAVESEPVESEPVPPAETEPTAEPVPATPEPVEPPASDDVVAPTATQPSPDETHVAALSPQGGDDPFAEVDGGDDAEPRTAVVPTADEDAALRDERARRFGRPREGGEAETTTLEESEPAEPRTAVVPLAAAGAGAVATVGDPEPTRTMPASTPAATTASETEEDPFKDFDDGPASRAAAHWWSILITVVLTPVAWYLIADGGERLNFNLTNGGPLNLAAPLELAAGALCLFLVLLAARWSSVGAIIVGSVAFLLGAAFIVFNSEAMDLVQEYQGTLVQGLKQLGQNIVDHMLADAQAGRLPIYGLMLIMVGVVSHGARRQGRREERRKAALGL